MKFVMIDEDIDYTQKAHAYSCPLAKCISRITGLVVGVASYINFLETRTSLILFKVPLPPECVTLRNSFDNGCKIEPIEFELEFTEEQLKMIEEKCLNT